MTRNSGRDERISVDRFLGICGGMDTTRVDLIDGTLWISGRLFYDFVKDYLAMVGEESVPCR